MIHARTDHLPFGQIRPGAPGKAELRPPHAGLAARQRSPRLAAEKKVTPAQMALAWLLAEAVDCTGKIACAGNYGGQNPGSRRMLPGTFAEAAGTVGDNFAAVLCERHGFVGHLP